MSLSRQMARTAVLTISFGVNLLASIPAAQAAPERIVYITQGYGTGAALNVTRTDSAANAPVTVIYGDTLASRPAQPSLSPDGQTVRLSRSPWNFEAAIV